MVLRYGTDMSEAHSCLPVVSLDAVVGCQRRKDQYSGALKEVAAKARAMMEDISSDRNCVPPEDFFISIRAADQLCGVALGSAFNRGLWGTRLHKENGGRHVTPLSAVAIKNILKAYVFSPYGQLVDPQDAFELCVRRADEEFLSEQASDKYSKMVQNYVEQQDVASGNVAPISTYMGQLLFMSCRKDIADYIGIPESRLVMRGGLPPEERLKELKNRVNALELKYRAADFDPSRSSRDQHFLDAEDAARREPAEEKADNLADQVKLVAAENEKLAECFVGLPFNTLKGKKRVRVELITQSVWELVCDRNPALFQKTNPNKPNKAEVARRAQPVFDKSVNQTNFVRKHVPDAVNWGSTVCSEFNGQLETCLNGIEKLKDMIASKEAHDAVVDGFGDVFSVFFIIDPNSLQVARA